jgi:hypothetical protein
VPEPSCPSRTSTSLVPRSARIPRTKGAVVPDPSSLCGMPEAACRREPWVAGRRVRGCARSPAVAGRPSHRCRRDPASAGSSTRVSDAPFASEDDPYSTAPATLQRRTTVARLRASSRCARSPAARSPPASCARSRAGSPRPVSFLLSRGPRPTYWPDCCGSSARIRSGRREPERRDCWTLKCRRPRRRHGREIPARRAGRAQAFEIAKEGAPVVDEVGPCPSHTEF